ncbi:N-acetyltransferase family protein [Microcella sp.]|uniref:GNAT family N-acetyltransferase n=1 Tax=Microcella sp. TaxID=1913979 RepID=UPI00391AFAF3
MAEHRSDVRVEPAHLVPRHAIDAVLGEVTDASRCWCRWWMLTNAEHEATTGDSRRGALDAELDAGDSPGLIASDGGTPLGWVGVAPRPRYRRIPRTRAIVTAAGDTDYDDEGVWSIVCFTIPRPHRGRGLAHVLLDAAIEHAIAAGAHTIEAYPHDTAQAPRAAGALNSGTLALFQAHGFAEVGRSGSRVVVRAPASLTPR